MRKKILRPFGTLRDALTYQLVRRNALYLLAREDDLALPRRQEAVDGAERRGLARAVGADQGDDLALLDVQGDPAQGLDVPVVAVHVLYLEQRHVL